MDRHGLTLLAIELGALALATLGIMRSKGEDG
jgi:hypothetical protein